MTDFVTGIDFGTTNSAAAISNANDTRMVPIDGAHDTMPTALYFPDNTHDVFIGHAAHRAYMSGDTTGRLMRSLKRILGTETMNGGTIINGRSYSFDTIIGYFIKNMKSQIDTAAGTDVTSVVMGRPVHFRDNDPAGDVRAQNELEQIARNVGFKNIEFQFEPIAAAFAHEQHISDEKLAIVVDIGGGTSDFTVIRLGKKYINKPNRMDDVLANTGVRIGGNDLDSDFAIQSFMPLFGMGGTYRSGNKIIDIPISPFVVLSTWSEINNLYNLKTLNMAREFRTFGTEPVKTNRFYEIISLQWGHTNLEHVEDAKIALSSHQATDVILEFLSDTPEFSVTRRVFENAIANNSELIMRCARECIKNAGVKTSDIELVILTGGTTEIPYITTLVRNLFPSAEISASNKMASVAIGLGHDARRRFL